MYFLNGQDRFSPGMAFSGIIEDQKDSPLLVFVYGSAGTYYHRYAALAPEMVYTLLEDAKAKRSAFSFMGEMIETITPEQLKWLINPQTPETRNEKVSAILGNAPAAQIPPSATPLINFDQLSDVPWLRGGQINVSFNHLAATLDGLYPGTHQLFPAGRDNVLVNIAQIKPEELQKGLDAWRTKYNLTTPHAG